MLGLLVILVISGLLLHFVEKTNLEALGLIPTKKRLKQFVLGLGLIVVINLITIGIGTYLKSIDWQFTGSDYQTFFKAAYYHLRSALTEDLIFRGALLYILIQRLGAKWALVVAAICFGVYHVFSYDMNKNNIIPIIYVILVTGFTGYVWAFIFYKTKSIALGLGLHFGYNLFMSCIYPSVPYGELLFGITDQLELSEWQQFYYALFTGFFPTILTLALIKVYFRFQYNNE